MDKQAVQDSPTSPNEKLAWAAPEVTIISTEQTDGKSSGNPFEADTWIGPS